jgi:exosortase
MSADSNSPQAASAPQRAGFLDLWQQMPNRGALLGLLAAWIALFQFLGNSTLGYVHSPSLFRWWGWTMHGIHDQDHAYVMPAVVLGLLWWKREDLAALPKRVWWPAVLFFVLAIAVHLMGYLVQQTRLSVAAFVAGIYALTGLVWGAAWLRATVFPFSLLLFCVPLGAGAEPLTVPLRLLATKITGVLCHDVLGISRVRQMGNLLYAADGTYQYEVAAVCSGIKSLMTIVVFGVIYGYLTLPSIWRRVFLVALAAPLAVVANVCRLTMIVVASEAFNPKAGHDVHSSEWISLVPYVPAFLGVVLAARWLRGGRKSTPKPQAAEPVLIAAAEQKS